MLPFVLMVCLPFYMKLTLCLGNDQGAPSPYVHAALEDVNHAQKSTKSIFVFVSVLVSKSRF